MLPPRPRWLEIPARLAWAHQPHETIVTSIRDVPHAPPQSGLSCRLVVSAERRRGARVSPEWLPDSGYLAHARGAENRLEVITADRSAPRVAGLGAERYPTATAILADLLDVGLAIRSS